MSFEHAVELKEDYSAKKGKKGRERKASYTFFFFLNMGPFENCSGVHCVVA